jgi:hypothetical protein
MTTHTLRLLAVCSAVIALLSIAVFSVWSYPDWMWLPLFLGTMVGGATALVASAELTRRLFVSP